jgi:predicted nuclease of predicted toxin-antitoxin system
MNKLLLDQGLPRSTALILRTRGWDVVHVGEVRMSSAKDLEILVFAYENERIVVTLDADFHSLLMVKKMTSPSVVRLRLEGLKGEELAGVLEKILKDVSDDLAHGAMVTVNKKTIRVHRLR